MRAVWRKERTIEQAREREGEWSLNFETHYNSIPFNAAAYSLCTRSLLYRVCVRACACVRVITYRCTRRYKIEGADARSASHPATAVPCTESAFQRAGQSTHPCSTALALLRCSVRSAFAPRVVLGKGKETKKRKKESVSTRWKFLRWIRCIT